MKGVDVLAVMDREMDGWAEDSEPYKELHEARAAVAELIEAAKEKQRVTGGGAACTVAESNAVYRRMDAALARATGAQA